MLVIRLGYWSQFIYSLFFLSASWLQLALTILQTKAETEISKAQKIVLEKDAELNAAEESLSGLKEVMHIVFLD